MRSETFSTPEPPTLRINIPSGEIRVEATDTAETSVVLSGPKEDEVRIEQRGNEIVIEVEGRKLFGRGGDWDLVVSTPNGARVDARTASADVHGEGRFGDVEVDSASGDVSFAAVDGRVDVNTASGDVRIEFVGGDLRVNSASGDITVVEAESDAKIRTASGDIEIRSAVRGKIDIQSASGDVDVGIRRGSKVFIDASSMSGDMSSELEVTDAPPPPPESDGPNIDFRARTMSGDVKVRRA
jgi:DUF4097 and DUF4098 domain-containing protein YvlB